LLAVHEFGMPRHFSIIGQHGSQAEKSGSMNTQLKF
jgi:hypothetical protein